jgi:tRNA (adenine37-N6)-methyltransferase
VLYWLYRSRRDLVHQSPRNDGTTRGTISLRSQARPSPIGASIASLIKVEGSTLPVRGLDCLDDTPLLGLKLFTPLVPPTLGDSDVGDP